MRQPTLSSGGGSAVTLWLSEEAVEEPISEEAALDEDATVDHVQYGRARS